MGDGVGVGQSHGWCEQPGGSGVAVGLGVLVGGVAVGVLVGGGVLVGVLVGGTGVAVSMSTHVLPRSS